jgi:hypothetical protein
MRFAFKTSPQNTTWDDMLAVWKEADDIELFESGWTFDHFYPIFSDSTGPCMEGWVTLTALAQATTRLRMGTLVTGIHYRHPAILANMATTLDIVSGGRLELGIGAGWNEEESGAYGIELGTPGQRRDDNLQGSVLPAQRGPQRAQAGAAPPSADLRGWERRKEDAPHRRPVRPALELRGWHAGGVRPQARHPASAL